MLLSLCMITKDEENNLARCLKSAQGIVDEVVIIDTGSTDNTVAIGRQLGARVYETSWRNDFSLARNESLAHARGTWVLVLDADEELLTETARDLRDILLSTPFSRFYLRLVNLVAGQRLAYPVPRLFRREGSRYAGRVHEQLVQEGHTVSSYSSVVILHHGYDRDVVSRKKKVERNLSILLEVWQDDPDPYVAYQVANAYAVSGDHLQALRWYHLAGEMGGLGHLAAKGMVHCLIELGHYPQALRVLADLVKAYPDYTDLYFMMGNLFILLGEVERAVTAFQICLDLGEAPPQYNTTEGVGSFLAHYNLGVIFEVTGLMNEAKRQYELAVGLGYHKAAERLAGLSSNLLSDSAERLNRPNCVS